MKDTALVLAMFAVAVLAILWWPIAIIWCVNTLFNTEIPVTAKTWVAVALLVTIFRVSMMDPPKKK